MKLYKIIFLSIITLSIFSCSKRTEILGPTNLDEIIRVAETHAIIADIDALISEADNISNKPKLDSKFCGAYTVNETKFTKTILFDFNKKCHRRNGDIEGEMSLVYEFTDGLRPHLKCIKTSFNNLTINGVKINGNEIRDIKKTENSHTFKINADVNVTWLDNTTATYEGIRTVKKILGTKPNDDITENTGNLNVKLRDNKEYTLEIKSPIIRKQNCKYYSKGELKIQLGDKGGILNYGDGQCDNTAVFTDNNGNSETIIL